MVRVRRRQEDLKAQALAQAQRDVRTATEQREALDVYQRQMLGRAGELMQGDDVDASALRQVYQHERHLARLGIERDADIQRLQLIAEGKRRELEEALKQRRVVEQLEARAVEQYRRFRTDLEQKQNDEIAAVRAIRGDRGAGP